METTHADNYSCVTKVTCESIKYSCKRSQEVHASSHISKDYRRNGLQK